MTRVTKAAAAAAEDAAPFEPDAASPPIEVATSDIIAPDAPIPTGQALVAAVAAHPGLVLLKPETFRPFMDEIRRDLAAFIPDMTTTRGRDEITAKAFKLTRTKTAIEAAGKRLTEKIRAEWSAMNELRDTWCNEIEALAQATRAPVVAWKKAEAERIDAVELTIASVQAAGVVQFGSTSASIDEQIEALAAREFDPAVFQERHEEVEAARTKSLAALERSIIAQRDKEAADAELQVFRAEKAKRDAEDAERLRAQAAEEKRKADDEAAAIAKREREDYQAAQMLAYINEVRLGLIGGARQAYGILLHELEIKIVARDFADRHQLSIESARAEAHGFLTKSMEEAARRQKEADDEAERIRITAAEQRVRDEAAAAHQAALDKIKREQEAVDAERQLQAEQARAAQAAKDAADAARAADEAHRKGVIEAAEAAIVAIKLGSVGKVSARAAAAVIAAIVAGEIPAVTIAF